MLRARLVLHAERLVTHYPAESSQDEAGIESYRDDGWPAMRTDIDLAGRRPAALCQGRREHRVLLAAGVVVAAVAAGLYLTGREPSILICRSGASA
jgi:hypothetical protein